MFIEREYTRIKKFFWHYVFLRTSKKIRSYDRFSIFSTLKISFPFFANEKILYFFSYFIITQLTMRDWLYHTYTRTLVCNTFALIFERRSQYWLAFCMFSFLLILLLVIFKCTHKAREKMCGAWHGVEYCKDNGSK